jgi:deoxyribodipyrimidine photo-lyase
MNIFWFRRDLRVEDNKGFFEALKSNLEVLPLFIFDKNINQDYNYINLLINDIFKASN